MWTGLAQLAVWYRHVGTVLPLTIGLLSILILFGCAIASWIAPSEKKDCLFHREVI